MQIKFLQNLKELASPKKTKTYIITGGLIIIILILFIIYPTVQDIRLTSNEITALKTQLLEQQSQTHTLENIIKSYQKYESKMELLNKTTITKNRELEFITTLEDVATRYNLEQKININDYQEVAGTAFNKMPLQLFLEGNFKDELSYLQDLEKLPTYINIKKIDISNAGTEDLATSTARTNMFISADTYWQ